jgi:hypothetical protein
MNSLWTYFCFLMQLLMLVLHPPPFFTKDIRTTSMDLVIHYRIESIACVLMLPRIVEVTWVRV